MRPSPIAAAVLLTLLVSRSLWAQALPPDSLPELKLVLLGEGDPLVLTPSRADRDKAIDALIAAFGTRAMSSNSFKVVAAYYTPSFYLKMQTAASTSAKKSFRIDLRLERGRWPRMVLQNDGEKRIELGERGMGERSSDEIMAALIHEAGHLGDDAFCGNVDYGADKSHYLEEVISPSGALFEGWGNLQELLLAPYSAKIANGYLGEKPDFELHAEKPGITASTSFADGYVKIPADQLTLEDFVANESFVANVLYEITLLGVPPIDAAQVVTDAFMDTSAIECRTLYDVLGAITRAQFRLRPEILEIVRRHSTAGGRVVGSDAEYDALVDGKWTSPRLTHARPRPSYAPPAPASTLGQ